MTLFDRLFPKTADVSALVEKAVAEQVAKTLNWASFFSAGKPIENIKADKTAYKSVASVYKSIKAIIDNAPQAKPIFTNSDGEMVDNRILRERFNRPNPKQSWNDFISELAGFYQIHGEAFILIDAETIGERSGTRLPSLIILDPSEMQEQAEGETLKAWKRGTLTYLPEQIIQIKDFNPFSKFRGLSPLEPIEREIMIDALSMLFNESFFKNDATPHMVLESDKALTEPQRQQLRKWWESKHKGASNAGSMGILEGGIKARTITSSHKDMDFIEQKKIMREEILGEFRAPKALFNITESLNYATFVGQMKVFWLYTLMPMLRKIEDAINSGYMSKYGSGLIFAFDYRNVPAFQEDFKDKIATATQLFAMGFTRNEINEELELGFEPKPWGDEWWVNSGMSPASSWTEDDMEETPPEEDNLDKAIGKAIYKDEKHLATIKGFLRSHETLEARMFKNVKKHFLKLRVAMLDLPDVDLAGGVLSINWENAEAKLKKSSEPIIADCVTSGIQVAERHTGSQKDMMSDLKEMAIALVQVRADKITGITKTVKKQLEAKIRTALTEGIIEGGTMSEMASGVRDIIRDYFNNAGVKSKLIARTETTGAMNGGSLLYYKEAGLEKKMWLTANDEFVRRTHTLCQGQGMIPMDESFSNGLLFPGDQDAGDVGELANCRCTLIAE